MKDILSLREEALEVIVVFPNGDHGSLRGGAILHGLVEFMHASGLSKIIDILPVAEDIVVAKIGDVPFFELGFRKIGSRAATQDKITHR